MALLSIVQGAMLRCNLPSPATAIGSPDNNVQRMIAFAQDAGDDLTERWKWLNLKSGPIQFTGTGAQTIFPLPANFDTYSPSMAFTSSVYPLVPLVGPINEDDLLILKGLPYTTYPAVWRRIGTNVEIYPAPASGEIISSVYSSSLWITNSLGTPYNPAVWTADTDLALIPERLIRLGAIWMWKRSQGLDYAEEFQTYEASFNLKAGQEDTERMISMSDAAPIGDTWFPGTITDLTSH